MLRILRSLCPAIFASLAVAVSAVAQTGSSSVVGTVADITNRVVPGSSITLINEASGDQRSEITNQTGDFVFASVNPGTYTVRIQSVGFRILERRGHVAVSSTRLSLGTLQLQAGTVNVHSIAEVKVLMGNYNAEVGRDGGAMISIITKSGGQQNHGSGWFYKRHDQFNATNYFNNLSSLGKPIYRAQTFGGDFAGK